MKNSEKTENIYYNWKKIEILVKRITNKIKLKNQKYTTILGIKNGGIIPAKLIAEELNIENIKFVGIKNKQIIIDELPLLKKNEKYLVVDEIFDTGYTYKIVYDIIQDFDHDFVVLLSRHNPKNENIMIGEILNHNKWIVFPWEK
ncbi:MAG: phosphoribosyltransferase [Nitrososphaeraceae archaeon]